MMQTKLWQADSVAVLMPPAKKGMRNRVPINICERLHHSFAAAFAGARPDCPFGSDGRLKIRVLPFALRPQAFRLRAFLSRQQVAIGIAGAREPLLVAPKLF